jgi:uncharacterized RDD family membrane protein YckC
MTSFREFQEDPRHQSPSALDTIPSAARGIQGERAGFTIRAISVALDVALIGLVMVGLWVGLWLFLLIVNPLVDYNMPGVTYFVLGGYVIIWLYWTWSWATGGRSVGQQLMGLRVVDNNGGILTGRRSLLRAGFCVLFQPGILWALISRRNRSVQDVVLRTSVIHDWSAAVRPQTLRARTTIGNGRGTS